MSKCGKCKFHVWESQNCLDLLVWNRALLSAWCPSNADATEIQCSVHTEVILHYFPLGISEWTNRWLHELQLIRTADYLLTQNLIDDDRNCSSDASSDFHEHLSLDPPQISAENNVYLMQSGAGPFSLKWLPNRLFSLPLRTIADILKWVLREPLIAKCIWISSTREARQFHCVTQSSATERSIQTNSGLQQFASDSNSRKTKKTFSTSSSPRKRFSSVLCKHLFCKSAGTKMLSIERARTQISVKEGLCGCSLRMNRSLCEMCRNWKLCLRAKVATEAPLPTFITICSAGHILPASWPAEHTRQLCFCRKNRGAFFMESLGLKPEHCAHQPGVIELRARLILIFRYFFSLHARKHANLPETSPGWLVRIAAQRLHNSRLSFRMRERMRVLYIWVKPQ